MPWRFVASQVDVTHGHEQSKMTVFTRTSGPPIDGWNLIVLITSAASFAFSSSNPLGNTVSSVSTAPFGLIYEVVPAPIKTRARLPLRSAMDADQHGPLAAEFRGGPVKKPGDHLPVKALPAHKLWLAKSICLYGGLAIRPAFNFSRGDIQVAASEEEHDHGQPVAEKSWLVARFSRRREHVPKCRGALKTDHGNVQLETR